VPHVHVRHLVRTHVLPRISAPRADIRRHGDCIGSSGSDRRSVFLVGENLRLPVSDGMVAVEHQYSKYFLILRFSDQRRHPSTAQVNPNMGSRIAGGPNTSISSKAMPSSDIFIHRAMKWAPRWETEAP